jgi:membrane protease subunit HflK
MAWNEPGGNGSNKDPWGHRKDEQGPPDLDEIVKKMQDKLGGLFGGGGNNDNSNEEDGLSWTAIFTLAIILLSLWSLFGFYIVQPAEVGIITRFGAYDRTTKDGLNWHIPYPIERVQKVNVQQVQAVPHKALMLTQDENLVVMELVVQYRVKDAVDYLFNVSDPDKTLHQATETALREVVGTSNMDDVLTSERDRVAAETKTLTQTIMERYKTGLTVISVNMQNAQPPEEVQDAFADAIKAREDEERYKNKAEAYSNEIVQKAGGASDKWRQEAQAYKAQVIAHGEGETKRFLSILTEYEKAPEITRKRLYLEAVETMLFSTRKILVDVQGGNNLMVFPLDRLLNDTTTGQVTQSTSTLPSMTPPSTNPLEDSKRDPDAARSRGGR